jgi:hypothetical protein
MVELGEHFASIRKQHLAWRSQLDAAAVTPQELRADLILEATYGLTQRRLREWEIFGSAGEAQPLRDRNEVAKISALSHAAMLSTRPMGPYAAIA